MDDPPVPRDIRPGQVYRIPDHVIEFPAAPSAHRTRHDDRYAIVVQGQSLCTLRNLLTVQLNLPHIFVPRG